MNITVFAPEPAKPGGGVNMSRGIFMNRQLVEQASKIVPFPPVLINAVSKRVRQLNAGARPLIEVLPRMDNADIALAEIVEGKIKVHEKQLPDDSQ